MMMYSSGDENAWKVGFNEKRPMPAPVWGWIMIILLLVIQTDMVILYTDSSTFMQMNGMPIWQNYVILQIICIAYSWVACNYLLPRCPTIFGLPFFLIAFGPAFVICAFPFFTDFGKEFAENAPLWVLTAWSAVRLMFESIVQTHASFGVKGISYWLLWPVQKAPEEYTMTYPLFDTKVTRTRGANLDAFGSLVIGLPVAFLCYVVNDDNAGWVRAVVWVAQVWLFIYLIFLGPVPHFLMGMPGPNNIFDGKGAPRHATDMHALTSGTLGTSCYWIASYAVIHFIVFVRKMI